MNRQEYAKAVGAFKKIFGFQAPKPNSVKHRGNESLEHFIAKSLLAYDLIREGSVVFTEVEHDGMVYDLIEYKPKRDVMLVWEVYATNSIEDKKSWKVPVGLLLGGEVKAVDYIKERLGGVVNEV